MNKCLLACSLAAVFAVTLPLAAVTLTYNPVTQFSLTSNPNSPWSYGYGSVGSGPVTLFTQTVSSSGAGYSYNGWAYNTLPTILVGSGQNGTVNAPAGDLVMHPGNADNLASILVFTAPTTGLYTLAGLFERDDNTTFGTGTNVNICKNTTSCNLYSNYLAPGGGYLSKDLFSLNASLNAGDTLDFVVSRTGGSYAYDTTGLQLNITTNVAATPEPSSLVLLGTGILGLCGAVKRKFTA